MTSAAASQALIVGQPILQVRGLTKRFGGLIAVDGVSFQVRRGGIAALIGPNGAGKTTTFNLLTGFMRPDAGTILFDGDDVTGMSPNRLAARGLVRTFQTARLFPSMTVREIIATAAMVKDRGKTAYATAEEVIAKLGIERLAPRYPGELSLPDRQMVELAKVISMRPSMVLLDEIMGGLNRAEADGPVQAIRDLNADGVTFLLVEHVMPIVMSLAEHIVVLDFGRVIASGTPTDITADPAVQRSYLGEAAS